MSDSLTNTELRDKITQLVFEWHREVQKMPRGKTISFWKDKEVMALISDTVAKAEREAYKKGYADKGIEELMKHENDKGNQI